MKLGAFAAIALGVLAGTTVGRMIRLNSLLAGIV